MLSTAAISDCDQYRALEAGVESMPLTTRHFGFPAISKRCVVQYSYVPNDLGTVYLIVASCQMLVYFARVDGSGTDDNGAHCRLVADWSAHTFGPADRIPQR